MPNIKKKTSKAKPIDKSKTILFGLVALLIVTCTLLSFAYYGEKNKIPVVVTGDFSSMYVNLGALQYNIDNINHKISKRTDASFKELKTFLTNESNNSRCGNSGGSNGPGYEYVVASSSDETQVLLSYGCNYPGPKIFAVKGAQGWKTISPTNHFDIFGIPDCKYLTENNISPEIAPVCVNGLDLNGVSTANPRYLNR